MTGFVRKLIVLGAPLIAAACASTQTSYMSPRDYPVKTERMINKPFDKVWDSYIEELSKSFFVINNISKESHILNVSFGADKPSSYVDCGQTTRVTVHPNFGKRVFNYLVANDSSYLFGVKGTNILWTVNRDTDLSGRVNIYIAPRGEDKTIIRVNVRYVLTIRTTGYSTNGQRDSNVDTFTFSSTQPDYKTDTLAQDGPKTWGCAANGILEAKLLNLIEPES